MVAVRLAGQPPWPSADRARVASPSALRAERHVIWNGPECIVVARRITGIAEVAVVDSLMPHTPDHLSRVFLLARMTLQSEFAADIEAWIVADAAHRVMRCLLRLHQRPA